METVAERTDGYDLRIADTADQLAHAVAEAMVQKVSQTLARQAHFSLVLSGGSTPQRLYRLLASEYAQGVEWQRVHLFWGDERYVPHDHPASNYRLVRETLIEPLQLPAENVHPMPTHLAVPDDAARLYEGELRAFFGETPRFDLVLLGMGADGHTASLFPNTAAVQERERWVAVGEAPVEPRRRLTLTFAALNAAKMVYFLVIGADKAEAVRRVLVERAPLPAALVLPSAGKPVWWLDRDAAQALW
ncbi:MAG: 6-phosphogluconolactonase [bacterium]|nr:6-phosphogluconolactonase [bacterium]MCS7310307.1 6-phosphogluconolactonase [Armatimonadota bacterium]MDW8104702.1 6-phosphogluconolactonase [Armatimonadota bacterium]